MVEGIAKEGDILIGLALRVIQKILSKHWNKVRRWVFALLALRALVAEL